MKWRRADIRTSDGSIRDDDWRLYAGDGRELARIYQVGHGPRASHWFWAVQVDARAALEGQDRNRSDRPRGVVGLRRENNRRVSNGEKFLIIAAASAAYPISPQWKGYWQRSEN
jgi:hypothetical protein